MKGPRSRHRYCVLRIWECPHCARRALGPVCHATRLCECRGKDRPTWMRLIDPPPSRRSKPPSETPAAQSADNA